MEHVGQFNSKAGWSILDFNIFAMKNKVEWGRRFLCVDFWNYNVNYPILNLGTSVTYVVV